jgi:hypothetical protein
VTRLAPLLVLLALTACGGQNTTQPKTPSAQARISTARATLASSLVLAQGDTVAMQRATRLYLDVLDSLDPELGPLRIMRELNRDRAGILSFCLPCSLSVGEESNQLMDEALASN